MSVRDIETKSKKVLVRVDFNVPLDERGEITDDNRIRAALPTIKYLIERGARVILISHLGRPKGKAVDALRLRVIAQRLSQILGQLVGMTADSIGPEVKKAIDKLGNGDVLLLENVRFYPEEENNDTSFAQSLAQLGEIYVNDAFGAAHRAHASVVGITNHLPAVAGLLLEKEVKTLGGILENPDRPFALLLGGAKISEKIGMLENIKDKADTLLIGGGMAATFLKANSYEIGSSLLEEDKLEFVTKLMQGMVEHGIRLLLPIDVIVTDKISTEAKGRVVPIEDVPSDLSIVDIGPRTIESFSHELKKCKTVFWNGPMGIYEIPQFATGTQAMARLLANLKATTVIGGGSTAEAVAELKLIDKMTFVSTGGGASLEFLSGEVLPGVEALMDKQA